MRKASSSASSELSGGNDAGQVDDGAPCSRDRDGSYPGQLPGRPGPRQSVDPDPAELPSVSWRTDRDGSVLEPGEVPESGGSAMRTGRIRTPSETCSQEGLLPGSRMAGDAEHPLVGALPSTGSDPGPDHGRGDSHRLYLWTRDEPDLTGGQPSDPAIGPVSCARCVGWKHLATLNTGSDRRATSATGSSRSRRARDGARRLDGSPSVRKAGRRRRASEPDGDHRDRARRDQKRRAIGRPAECRGQED